MAHGDLDLRLHDIDRGDFLGDGVFDLNPWVHFDEIPLARFDIDEELHGAGVGVVDLTGDRE